MINIALKQLARPPARLFKLLLRLFAYSFARYKPVRSLVIRYYDFRQANRHRRKPHPVDLQYGINTVGHIPGYALVDGSHVHNTTGYDGAPATLIRQSLALLAEPAETVLLDLGCGKGRVLAVGSELPFREVIGVELSDILAATAEANLTIVRRNFPERCPIRVVAGDAVEYPFPDSRLAIFLFNPFGDIQVARLLRRIEEALQMRTQQITIIYANPVWGSLFDASPWLVREHALYVPWDDEIEMIGIAALPVVIWRDRHHAATDPSLEASRRIVKINRHHAELAPVTSAASCYALLATTDSSHEPRLGLDQ